MQMSAAMPSACSTMARASRSVLRRSAVAAACAKAPPEPTAIRSCSGSITSPLPEITNEWVVSATHSSASRRRRLRSERQSLASSIAARVRLPYCCSLPSKRSKSVKASAVPPANPAMTLPSCRRRTLRALPFMMVLPRVTWPSPPMATRPLRRTHTMVVPWGSNVDILGPLAPCPGVGSVVDAGQVLEIKMGVHLGRADVGVAEQFLHRPQVARRLQQVRREGMPEQVRVHVLGQALQASPAGDAPLHDARPEAAAVHADEYCGLFHLCQGRALGQPLRKRL